MRRALLPLIVLSGFAAFTGIAGCDTGPPAGYARSSEAPATPIIALSVPLSHSTQGDFVYSLDPLAPGDVFKAETTFEMGKASLVSRGTTYGIDLSLATVNLSPDSATVEYLNDGVPTALPFTYRLPTSARATSARRQEPSTFESSSEYPVGSTENEPTSYHYEERDGRIILVKDYNGVSGSNQARGARSGAASTVATTLRGESVRVTEIMITLYGVSPGVPRDADFESSRPLVLDWFDLTP